MKTLANRGSVSILEKRSRRRRRARFWLSREAASGLPRPHYYIAGTPDMCEAMRQMLDDDMGIDDQDIHSEDFTGYT